MLLLALWLIAAEAPVEAPQERPLPEVGATSCVCCGAGAATARELVAAEEWSKLRSGALLRRAHRVERASGLQGGAEATSLLPYPPEQVWDVLTDFESWPGFMPHITATEITRREGRREWVQQDFKVLLKGLRHTTVYELDPRRGELRWKLDLEQPHDIAGSRGRWQLAPADQGRATLLRYSAEMDSGRSVPAFVERMLVERSVEDLFESLRAELERRSEAQGE